MFFVKEEIVKNTFDMFSLLQSWYCNCVLERLGSGSKLGQISGSGNWIHNTGTKLICRKSPKAEIINLVNVSGFLYKIKMSIQLMLLCAGVLKNSSNSLLPDITASTTFSFGAARQLKSGSVMDILGSSLAERPDHWVLPAPSQGWLAAVGIRY